MIKYSYSTEWVKNMRKEFSNIMSTFWTTVMDKLNESTDKKEVINSVLKDICRYFNFGCSFFYTCNQDNAFSLSMAHHAYLNFDHLSPVFNLKDVLGVRQYHNFSKKGRIAFDELTKKTELEESFARLFNAKSLIVIPLKRKDNSIYGLLGMADRRGEVRKKDQSLEYAYYILMVLANYISIYMLEKKREKTMKTLNKIINNSGVEVHVIDYKTQEILYGNEEFMKKFGPLPEGIKCYDFFYPGSEKACKLCPRKIMNLEGVKLEEPFNYQKKNSKGEYRRYIATKFHWVDGREVLSISSVDITENIQYEKKLRHYAKHDALTGLGNRHKLLIDCDDFLERLRKEKRQGYVLFADVDDFKEVNDQYGHTVGDALLKEIGDFFNAYLKTRNRAYRYAGDEFVFLLDGIDEGEMLQIKAEIVNRFKQPFVIGDLNIYHSISIGMTRTNGFDRTTTELLNDADIKMYEMKKRKREKQRGVVYETV